MEDEELDRSAPHRIIDVDCGLNFRLLTEHFVLVSILTLILELGRDREIVVDCGRDGKSN